MKNPFSKIFKTQAKLIPETIKVQLEAHFPGAINIDWEIKANKYEAVFYLNDVEYIALFSYDGKLLEYKKNLWPAELSEEITRESIKFGEIMNSIAIYREGIHLYEVIVRDKNLERKLLIFNHMAKLIESKKI